MAVGSLVLLCCACTALAAGQSCCRCGKLQRVCVQPGAATQRVQLGPGEQQAPTCRHTSNCHSASGHPSQLQLSLILSCIGSQESMYTHCSLALPRNQGTEKQPTCSASVHRQASSAAVSSSLCGTAAERVLLQSEFYNSWVFVLRPPALWQRGTAAQAAGAGCLHCRASTCQGSCADATFLTPVTTAPLN